MDTLIRLSLAKAVLDLQGHLPNDMATSPIAISFTGIVPADRVWNINSVLNAMGDSFESWPTSPMVRHSSGVLAAAGAHHLWAVNLYLIVLMGSAVFAHTFLNSGLLTRRFGPHAKLDAFLRNNRHLHPAQFVGAATRAGRVLHNALSRLGKSQAKRILLSRLPRYLRRPALKAGRRWVDKQAVLGCIRRYPGFGMYNASVYWRMFRLRYPTYPITQDNSFCYVGPTGSGTTRPCLARSFKTNTMQISLLISFAACKASSPGTSAYAQLQEIATSSYKPKLTSPGSWPLRRDGAMHAANTVSSWLHICTDIPDPPGM